MWICSLSELVVDAGIPDYRSMKGQKGEVVEFAKKSQAYIVVDLNN
jgi:hypothetical protein